MEKCEECGRENSVLRKSLLSNKRLCLECRIAERKRPLYVRMTVVGKDGINFYR